jgi:hypothetical protein
MAQIVKLRRSSVSGQKPTNSNLQLGELALNTTDGKVYMAKSGSLGPSVEELISTNTVNTGSVNISGSINLHGNQIITGSLTVTEGSLFGNLIGSASSAEKLKITTDLLTDDEHFILFAISGSGVEDVTTNTYVRYNPQLERFSIRNINAATVTGSIFTGSFKGDGSQLYNIPISGVTNLGGVIDSLQLYTGALNNFTSSFILDTQTSSMTVLSASYAVTAAFALNGGGGAEGRTSKLEQTISSTTWTFNHNLGEQHPAIVVFNEFDEVIIPGEIYAQDENTLIISFSSAQSGVVTATVGGGLPYISGSFDGYVLSVDDNAPTWKGGLISGSLQISNFGFSTTGSNTFTDDQTIEGTLSISGTLVQQTTTTGVTTNTVIAQFPTGSYDAGFFDYVIKNGTNLRAGTVTSVWLSNNVVFNEVTTNDLGNTTNVTMTVSIANGNANLNANVSSGTWTIKVLSRGL